MEKFKQTWGIAKKSMRNNSKRNATRIIESIKGKPLIDIICPILLLLETIFLLFADQLIVEARMTIGQNQENAAGVTFQFGENIIDQSVSISRKQTLSAVCDIRPPGKYLAF